MYRFLRNTPKILILVPDFEYITLKKIFLRICSIFAFCNECNMQIKEYYRKMFGYYNASDSKQRWQLRVIIHDNIIRLVCFKRNLTSFWLAYKTALWYLKKYSFTLLHLIGESKHSAGKTLLGLFCLFCFGWGVLRYYSKKDNLIFWFYLLPFLKFDWTP